MRASRAGTAAVLCAASALLLLGSAGPLAADPSLPRLPAFDPDAATPYFRSGPAQEARELFERGQWARAADAFASFVKRASRADKTQLGNQARFLCAQAELKAGRFASAAARFGELVESYPILGDHHRLGGARALLSAGRSSAALALAAGIDASSALDAEARVVRGDALTALGRHGEAVDTYRGYLTAYPDSWRAPELRARLAGALEAAGRTSEAAPLWRQLYLEAPTERWGREAERRLSSQTLAELDASALSQRALALFDAMRNSDSEREWARVLKAPGLTDSLACVARYHLAQSVFKQRDRTRAAPLFDEAATACARAGNEDLQTKALYQGARSWGTRGDKDIPSTRRAAALFERIWREHAGHSYADDARLRAAELYDALKEEDRGTELLLSIPAAHPTGDQRGEALWRLAFRAWRRGDLKAAGFWWSEALAKSPREDGWWEAGRTLYWLGRVATRTQDQARAVETYARAIREYPLAYYGLMALGRLRALAPDRARALEAELAPTDPAAPQPVRLAPRPLFGAPAFLRAVELARLGLGSEARRELGQAGIRVPTRRAEINADAETEDLLWVAATLYDRAGELALSHFIPRYLLPGYARSFPGPENRARWLISYPRGWASLVEENAAANQLPTALQYAIIREESAFDPNLESFANAVGLTQLTAAPAARFAAGLPHDPQALRVPSINLAIGARELGHLYKLYAGNAALAIAAYNAGEGAVGRWLRDPERRDLELDEFIESIPYDETRGYTKRVLGSYFAYSWLYAAGSADRVPPLALDPPRRR